MKRVPISDVFCALVPRHLIDADEDTAAAEIGELAKLFVAKQYVGIEGLLGLEDMVVETLVTEEPDEVDAFQPAHDCAACLAGNDRAKAHLREHPDQPVALANIYYTEVWA